jgi:mannitol/fructose-specific phosphotransferase system IIA component (Ntr-type)
MGERLLEGFRQEDFSMPGGDNAAYFARQTELAQQFAEHYGEGVLEVQIRQDVYNARLLQYEKLYQNGPYTELAIPHSEFDVLNDAIRILHK